MKVLAVRLLMTFITVLFVPPALLLYCTVEGIVQGIYASQTVTRRVLEDVWSAERPNSEYPRYPQA